MPSPHSIGAASTIASPLPSPRPSPPRPSPACGPSPPAGFELLPHATRTNASIHLMAEVSPATPRAVSTSQQWSGQALRHPAGMRLALLLALVAAPAAADPRLNGFV